MSWLAFDVVDFCCVFTKSSSVVGWRCEGLFVFLFIGVLKPGVPMPLPIHQHFWFWTITSFCDILVCTNPFHWHLWRKQNNQYGSLESHFDRYDLSALCVHIRFILPASMEGVYLSTMDGNLRFTRAWVPAEWFLSFQCCLMSIYYLRPPDLPLCCHFTVSMWCSLNCKINVTCNLAYMYMFTCILSHRFH